MTYDAENWLLSTTRTLKAYVEANINTDVYDVVMEFPGPLLDSQTVPLAKTLVHFEIDDVVSRELGFGEGAERLNYDSVSQTVNPQFARVHTINFDVGIWASDRSGGSTSRMKLQQDLEQMFGSGGAVNLLRDFSDADDGVIDIVNYTGGRNAIDRINDVPVFRTVDGQLEIRVVSRTKLLSNAGPTIESLTQAPNLTIIG